MKIAGNQRRHCHSGGAERVEESKVLDSGIAGKSPTPHPWIPAYAGMTVLGGFNFMGCRTFQGGVGEPGAGYF